MQSDSGSPPDTDILDEDVEAPSSAKAKKKKKKTTTKVTRACFLCKKSHAACDTQRPCSRCVAMGRADSCVDAQAKKRGRKPRTPYQTPQSYYNYANPLFSTAAPPPPQPIATPSPVAPSPLVFPRPPIVPLPAPKKRKLQEADGMFIDGMYYVKASNGHPAYAQSPPQESIASSPESNNSPVVPGHNAYGTVNVTPTHHRGLPISTSPDSNNNHVNSSRAIPTSVTGYQPSSSRKSPVKNEPAVQHRMHHRPMNSTNQNGYPITVPDQSPTPSPASTPIIHGASSAFSPSEDRMDKLFDVLSSLVDEVKELKRFTVDIKQQTRRFESEMREMKEMVARAASNSASSSSTAFFVAHPSSSSSVLPSNHNHPFNHPSSSASMIPDRSPASSSPSIIDSPRSSSPNPYDATSSSSASSSTYSSVLSPILVSDDESAVAKPLKTSTTTTTTMPTTLAEQQMMMNDAMSHMSAMPMPAPRPLTLSGPAMNIELDDDEDEDDDDEDQVDIERRLRKTTSVNNSASTPTLMLNNNRQRTAGGRGSSPNSNFLFGDRQRTNAFPPPMSHNSSNAYNNNNTVLKSSLEIAPFAKKDLLPFIISSANKPFGILKSSHELRDGAFIAANYPLLKLFGYSLSELVGCSWRKIVIPECQEQCKTAIIPLLLRRSRKPASNIKRLRPIVRTKNGITFQLISKHQIFYDERGVAVLHILSSDMDVQGASYITGVEDPSPPSNSIVSTSSGGIDDSMIFNTNNTDDDEEEEDDDDSSAMDGDDHSPFSKLMRRFGMSEEDFSRFLSQEE